MKSDENDGRRPSKRGKSNNGLGVVVTIDCLLAAWEHYKNFIGIIDEDNENEIDEYENEGGEACGDIDELFELIEILSPYSDISFSSSSTCTIEFPHDGDFSQQTFLSILLSMANVHLASVAITDGNDGTSSTSSPEDFIQKSLQHWSTNPIAYKILADYHRRKCSEHSSLENVCTLYEKAAEYATYWRTVALGKMEDKDDEDNTDAATAGMPNVNEWVELLIIQGALDVESIYIDNNDDGDDEDEEDGEIYTSSSRVESTSSFMSAYLLSALSKHDKALVYLKKFHLSHRIHPNVWLLASNHAQLPSTSSLSSDIGFSPRIHCGSSDSGVLPPKLYEQLCHLFAPGASYWKESDYNNRGYFSYFIGLNDINHVSPTNIIEDVIVNHLLPHANQSLRDTKVGDPSSQQIIGAEWWVHTRPLGANLGHQIHYDTDECMLSKKKVTHPVVSSVLYLTGAGKRDRNEADDSATQASATAGSTIIFDQSPESTNVASQAWVSQPRDNSFMTFPGNLLHGVLPCTDVRVSDNSDSNNEDEGLHRLTILVGFWTRDVRDGMGERELYSPCGQLPPPTLEHSWVMQSQTGYTDRKREKKEQKATKADDSMMFTKLPSTSPAWEKFSGDEISTLTIPKELDHRFFVWNAPHCFTESLFDKKDHIN